MASDIPRNAPSLVVIMFEEGVTERQARDLAKQLGLKTMGRFTRQSRLLSVQIDRSEKEKWVGLLNAQDIVKLAA